MGLWGATALVVGNQLGVGVFTLPAALAPYGWNAMLGWAASIAGALALAVIFARLATRVAGSGGPYVYTRAAFGERAGFVVAWGYWNGTWVGTAAIPVASVGYLAVFWPELGTTRPLATGLAIASVWLFTIVNIVGARAVGRVAIVTTLIKLVPLVAAIGLGVWVLGAHGAASITPARVPLSGHGIAATALLALFALQGIESATIPAGKIVNPRRTIARATIGGTALSAAVTLAVASAVMLMGPPASVAASNAPIADFAARWAGGSWAAPVAAFAAISGFGCLCGWLLVQGEMPAAMARDGVFPRILARVDTRGTPVLAHLVTSALLTGLLALNAADNMVDTFVFVAEVSVLTYLFAYLACAVAAIRLHGSDDATFVGVAAFAATYSAWAITGASTKAFWWFGGLMLAGLPVYAFTRWRERALGTSPVGVAAAPLPPG